MNDRAAGGFGGRGSLGMKMFKTSKKSVKVDLRKKLNYPKEWKCKQQQKQTQRAANHVTDSSRGIRIRRFLVHNHVHI